MRTPAVAALTAVLLLTAACGSSGQRSRERTGADGTRTATPSAGASASASPSPEPTSCPGGGQLIKAVEIPAVHADPVHIPEATAGGTKIPAVTIPGVDIPAQRVPAQCVDIRPAPGGCLSAVSIPGTRIPAVTVPGVEIPGVDAGGIKADPIRVPAATAREVGAAPVHADEVCQLKPSREGEYVASAYRPSVYRPSVYRHSVYRASVFRPRLCNSNNKCIPQVSVPPVSVPSVTVPPVSVPSATLKGYTAGKNQVLRGDGSIAYAIEADVLFDFGRADIKPAAVAELRGIADAIRRDVPSGASVQIDGHTDATGDPASNQRLSEQRAKAVLTWLATEGGLDRSRLRATGYGETKPVAPNTTAGGADDPRGRAKNRRVVISARQDGGQKP